VNDDGTICARFEGPAHRRAIKGQGLVERDRLPDDYDSFENTLYTIAIQAGWLPDEGGEAQAAIPGADILVRVSRPRD
jgi:hypothetical protein